MSTLFVHRRGRVLISFTTQFDTILRFQITMRPINHAITPFLFTPLRSEVEGKKRSPCYCCVREHFLFLGHEQKAPCGYLPGTGQGRQINGCYCDTWRRPQATKAEPPPAHVDDDDDPIRVIRHGSAAAEPYSDRLGPLLLCAQRWLRVLG